jgi:hydrogenase/urease accessory protein HupE
MHISILLAHAGHAGDHGWLAGALQPLLSADHLLAGLFVAVVLSVALWRIALRAPRKGVPEAPRGS